MSNRNQMECSDTLDQLHRRKNKKNKFIKVSPMFLSGLVYVYKHIGIIM